MPHIVVRLKLLPISPSYRLMLYITILLYNGIFKNAVRISRSIKKDVKRTRNLVKTGKRGSVLLMNLPSLRKQL